MVTADVNALARSLYDFRPLRDRLDPAIDPCEDYVFFGNLALVLADHIREKGLSDAATIEMVSTSLKIIDQYLSRDSALAPFLLIAFAETFQRRFESLAPSTLLDLVPATVAELVKCSISIDRSQGLANVISEHPQQHLPVLQSVEGSQPVTAEAFTKHYQVPAGRDLMVTEWGTPLFVRIEKPLTSCVDVGVSFVHPIPGLEPETCVWARAMGVSGS